ncbi:MAG: dienelactone hydrolase family protein [Myxococcota bacterium]
MSGTTVEIKANASNISGYLATPAAGQGPGVLVLQEWWGLVPHIEQVADRLAAQGFVALAPDLYRGEQTSDPDEAGRRMMALNIEQTAQDLASAAAYVRALGACAPKKIGVLGFCMGGQLALFAATKDQDIGATVNFYGIHPKVEPDYRQLSGPVLCHFGEHDTFVAKETARQLVNELRAAEVAVEAHFYDAGHAFFNDSRAAAYDRAAAETAWSRTTEFLKAHLSA